MMELEKIAYAVVMASCKLHHYFEAFKVRVTSDRGLGELFKNPEASVRITKWAAELSGYHITFEPKTAIKSQVLADFIVDWTGPITQPDMSAEKVWTIHCDGAWCHAGAGATTVITSPTGVKHRYAARLSFALESDRCTNNVAEYKAVILGLRKLRALGVTTCIIRTDSKVVAGQVEKDYTAKDPALMQYLAAVLVSRDSSKAACSTWTEPRTRRPTHWPRQSPEARPCPPTYSTMSSARQPFAAQRASK
jgi:ribonuclease HI